MAKPYDILDIHKTIGLILSHENTTVSLKEKLTSALMNWDALVIEGSKHLVLPAIYCNLKHKALLRYLPEDLQDYLQEITELNSVRNEAILKQAHSLSELLKSNKIEHIFLKGTALMVGGYYKDIAERMIGDIDILINEDQIDFAYSILVDKGYKKTKIANYEKVGITYKMIGSRHIERMVSTSEIAAIELHWHCFNYIHRNTLDVKKMLSTRKLKSNFYIPKTSFLAHFSILGYQINDNGHSFLSYSIKNWYDLVVLKIADNNKFIKEVKAKKQGKSYLEFIKHFMPEYRNINSDFEMHYYWKRLKFNNRYQFASRILYASKKFFMIFYQRILFLLTNKYYGIYLIRCFKSRFLLKNLNS